MLPLSPRIRPWRARLALVAVVALMGACGSDENASNDTTTTRANEKTTTTADEEASTTTAVDDGSGAVCALLDAADLEDATGLPFEDQQGDDTSCVYTSSTGAAIAINVADVTEAPEAGFQGAQSTCDPGSVTEITITDADAAFTCLVTGIPTVAAVGGGGFLVVLTGDDADESVDDASSLDALVQVLENATTSA